MSGKNEEFEATTSSTRDDWKTANDKLETAFEENEEINDTCCGRVTFCCPVIRDVIVDEPILPCTKISLTWANLFWMTTCLSLVMMTWATLFLVLGDRMLPGGDIFGVFVVSVSSYALGWSLTYIPWINLPPAFGMLMAGIIIRNAGIYNIHDELGFVPTAKIRTFCLSFIMIRAGFQLTTTPLREHRSLVLLLAIVPSTLEMLASTVLSRYVLHLTWPWAFLTGTVVACMSPVVTVNCILALAEKGYGEDKGIASLLCTTASIENVHMVSIFSLCFALVFSNDSADKDWWSNVPVGLRDLMAGFVVGLALGFFLAFFPHRNHKHVLEFRIASLFVAAAMCSLAASKLAITGGGYLAIFIMSYIAITGWKILTVDYDVIPLQKAASRVWHFTQPILVGVIGADIDFATLPIGKFGIYTACVALGLLVRLVSAFAVAYKSNLTTKERFFVALSLLPKGSLQAALAPMAYERGRKVTSNDVEKLLMAFEVIRISVVAIIFMAPLGAILMMSTGPLLLRKIDAEARRRERQLSFLRIMSLQPVKTKREREYSAMKSKMACERRNSNRSNRKKDTNASDKTHNTSDQA